MALSGLGERVLPELADRLSAREVVMPRLDERREDVPELVEMQPRRVDARFGFQPGALSALMRAPWEGQVGDLRRLVEALQAAGAEGPLRAVDPDPFLAARQRAAGPLATSEEAERAWLLDMLRSHGFNRTAAARAMGVSRKRLYNRLRRHAP